MSVNHRSETTAEDDVREWLDALDSVVATEGPEAAEELLRRLKEHARAHSLWPTMDTTTPYVNTIPVHEQAPLPEEGSDLRRKIKSLVRWNAMAMVVRANRESDGIGGHISTYASAATLYETAFNFFFRAKNSEYGGDQIYFQGHAAPGIYARAFLEGRLSQAKLENFRLELHKGGGLSSYPHPWLMPDFWQFPTVSMGLGPIMAIYQARFMRYLENRGLKPKNGGRVWAFLGDGECDEPESLGAIGMAVREKLDNLIFVINCNLQRLDGPVRGNGKIIQELEGIFQGAGWNVIKVIWGSDWDRLFAQDTEGVLESVFSQIPDGEFQKFTVAEPEYIRRRLTERDPRMKQFLDQLSDSELKKIKRGGHDPRKVYAAYHRAVNNTGAPTVILAKTVKGYGLGESGEGKNITHQQKKMNEEELRNFRGRFGVPISDDEIAFAPFYKPDDNNPAIKHMHELRAKLGGYVPSRSHDVAPIKTPDDAVFAKLYQGSERPVSTTMAFVQVLRALLSDMEIGKLIVPIVPDEARTFGMDGLFKQVGIYSSAGQRYDPVDSESLMSYREATDGQLLEEGINEAGSMSSFIAAGTAYSTHGINTIPFFIYYSMFGMQRIGDLVWAAGDSRCKGFLVGGTAGRTTLNGEGLQHQDGHSHILSSTVPNLISYDVAFAYELAIVVRDGIRRMYEEQEDVFYYLTVENENYPMPALQDSKRVREGIIKGMYKYKPSTLKTATCRAQLLGSGAIMNEVLKAQSMLEEYGVAADAWSVTSYTELRRDGLDCDRWNLLHPGSAPKVPFVAKCLKDEPGVVVAASDYMKILPDGVAKWLPNGLTSLGTDGFGRSESREALRDFFEVDARFVTLATLTALMNRGEVSAEVVKKAVKALKIAPNKLNPMHS